MRFDKSRRVRKRSEYQRIQAVGCRVTTPHFVLLAAARATDVRSTEPSRPTAGLESRLGITASRKVGGAVRRNRLKRVVRAAYRLYPEVVPDGVDLVVICRKDADLGTNEVIAEWKSAQAKLRKRLAEGPRPNPARFVAQQKPRAQGRRPGGDRARRGARR